MAYVAPNSTVEFFGDLGLNDNYDDTLYFASESAKNSYFSGLTKLATGTAMTYTREQRGFLRVELPMSTLISASYMRYKNTSFENKWFYAFIKNVEYINNNCTQVNFSIDPMMTWMGTFHLNQCFIERQHVSNDAIGANIVDEGLALGEYVCENTETASLGDYAVIVYKTYHEGDTMGNLVVQGTYVPLYTFGGELDEDVMALTQSILDNLVTSNRGDEIVAIKLAPARYNTNGASVPSRTKAVVKPYTNIGGSTYQPRNKKLFTYPYKFLRVENCEGESVVYKYEYFNSVPDSTSGGDCNFEIIGTAVTPEISVMCIPTGYNGMPKDFEEAISMVKFPSIAWNVDSYKAYLAQRDSTIVGNFITDALQNTFNGAMKGAITAGPTGAIAGGTLGGIIGGLTNGTAMRVLSDEVNDKLGTGMTGTVRMPNQTRGKAESNLMVQTQQKQFYFRKMCITKNYAMMIDDYFDMFGYAIKQHGVPNMNVRPYWTFVKTIGCSVDGAIPADDASAIENIFNKGVRFWKNHNNIGNYSLDNAPA